MHFWGLLKVIRKLDKAHGLDLTNICIFKVYYKICKPL